MPKAETQPQSQSQVPAGYTAMTGNLPPFVSLAIDQTLHGQVFRVRKTTKTEKVKVKGKYEEIEKEKMYFDLTLVEPGTYNAGTLKKPDMREFESGSQVTLSGGGDITFAFKRKVYDLMGVTLAKGEQAPEPEWPLLVGHKVWIRRDKDGTVKGGSFAGNRKNSYTIAFSPKES